MQIPTTPHEIELFAQQLAEDINVLFNTEEDVEEFGTTKFLMVLLPPDPRPELVQVCNINMAEMLDHLKNFVVIMEAALNTANEADDFDNSGAAN